MNLFPQIKIYPRRISHFGRTLLGFFAIATSGQAQVPNDKPAHYPDWWFEQGVIGLTSGGDSNVYADYLQPADTSPILQGQLLHIAEAGINELNDQLAPIGGAGFDVNSFKDSAKDPAYSSPAAISQLKFVASKFYDKFAEIGYIPVAPDQEIPGLYTPILLTAEGVGGTPGVAVYPWTTNAAVANGSAALIGQTKHIFAWDLVEWVSEDTENSGSGDGLPDFWENFWYGGLSYGPNEDTDGDLILNIDEYASSTNPDSNISIDGDTLPDDWELFYGLDLENDDSSLDFDADGQTNLTEFVNDRDPIKRDHPALELVVF